MTGSTAPGTGDRAPWCTVAEPDRKRQGRDERRLQAASEAESGPPADAGGGGLWGAALLDGRGAVRTAWAQHRGVVPRAGERGDPRCPPGVHELPGARVMPGARDQDGPELLRRVGRHDARGAAEVPELAKTSAYEDAVRGTHQ